MNQPEEYRGKIPKSFITGKKEDEETIVDALMIVSKVEDKPTSEQIDKAFDKLVEEPTSWEERWTNFINDDSNWDEHELYHGYLITERVEAFIVQEKQISYEEGYQAGFESEGELTRNR